jgi:hypothetical protein
MLKDSSMIFLAILHEPRVACVVTQAYSEIRALEICTDSEMAFVVDHWVYSYADVGRVEWNLIARIVKGVAHEDWIDMKANLVDEVLPGL